MFFPTNTQQEKALDIKGCMVQSKEDFLVYLSIYNVNFVWPVDPKFLNANLFRAASGPILYILNHTF